MSHIEAPNVASIQLSSIRASAKNGALVSTLLIPSYVAARKITRLAFDLGGSFDSFRTAFQESDLSLSMDIRISSVQGTAQASSWEFEDFPEILPLSAVDDLHFQAQMWTNHNGGLVACDDDTEGLTDLAWAVVALLSSDDQVLLPRLAHLELVVGDIPGGLCELVVPALDGRRLRKLRIQLDSLERVRWAMRLMFKEEPDYTETGIYEHVDSVKIDEKTSIRRSSEEDGEEPSNVVGWGKWRACVQPARNDYW